MLPFPDNNQKLFCCFVCARIFKQYKEMQDHIIESHEQGREYLICPVKHCGAAVRDLRFHFRNKHKSCKCPENIQLRATVLYDIKIPGKRRKLPNFKEGYIISAKNNGKKMHYRSSWEEQVYESLEKMGDVIAYDVEPFSIPYYFKGKRHRYFPDLKVTYTNGIVEIWEIKPQTQITNERNQAKFKSAEYFCHQRGWKLEIITEQRIQKLKNS